MEWLMNKAQTILKCLFIAVYFTAVLSPQTSAIILHSDNQPAPEDRPHSDVNGRWSTNASCVVIAQNYIITTRHQGGADTTTVTIAGVPYTIDKTINHPTADLRVVRLNNANLTEYVSVNFDTSEQNEVAVLAGFGVTAGDPLTIHYLSQDYTYGYPWLYPTSPTPDNGILRWGTNKVVALATSTQSDYLSQLLVSQFDGPSATDYECTIGEFDSGGGWFLQTADGWKVIGLNRGTIPFGQSWFINPNDPTAPMPDYPNDPLPNYIPEDEQGNVLIVNYLDAVRISQYADWIVNTINASELQNMAVNWLRTDCDSANNFCNGADLTQNHKVDFHDFLSLAVNWLKNK